MGLGTTTPLMLVLWCALYVGAVVALWVTAWQDYAASGVCTQVARAAGANLNMHGALMLITMLPKTHTALGAVPWLAVWLPLDLMNTGHKIFSCMTGVFAVIHTTAHAANWMTQAGGGHDLAMTKIFTVTRTLGLVPGWAGPTGVALWLCYVVLFAGWSSRISWMMFEGARSAAVAVRLQARPTPFPRPRQCSSCRTASSLRGTPSRSSTRPTRTSGSPDRFSCTSASVPSASCRRACPRSSPPTRSCLPASPSCTSRAPRACTRSSPAATSLSRSRVSGGERQRRWPLGLFHGGAAEAVAPWSVSCVLSVSLLCSLLEWHPFTISSGPERNDVGGATALCLHHRITRHALAHRASLLQELTLHVRVASETGWTMSLRKMLETRERAACAVEQQQQRGGVPLPALPDAVGARPSAHASHSSSSAGIKRRLINAIVMAVPRRWSSSHGPRGGVSPRGSVAGLSTQAAESTHPSP